MTRVRMKVTIVGYYDADPVNYDGETDPMKMAGIDFDNTEADAIAAVCLMDEDLLCEVTIGPDPSWQQLVRDLGGTA